MLRSLLFFALLSSGPALAAPERVPPQVIDGNPWLISHGRPTFKSASADTFCLYGGPGAEEGKFQDPLGVLPDAQGWTSEDLTDVASRWQVSTFNATTLNTHGAGNRAMWCGQDASQQPGWVTAPGYGNDYDEALVWSSGPLADPSAGQTVDLEFWFHHDVEPAYDYFHVEAWIAGGWTSLHTVDGSDKDASGIFSAPGVHYPDDVAPLAITYAGNDYGGPGGDEILLRLRVTSDGGFSDEDGYWPTDGAAQVDDITVTYADGGPQSSFEDFEGAGPYAWIPVKGPYAGDFAQVFPVATDLDPCVDNATPFWGFMDDGSGPFNPDYTGTGTGGETSAVWSYGVPGGWIVNYTGGVSGGWENLSNQIVSPPIAWDLPGPADDDPDLQGALLRFDVWNHTPLSNGIFWSWFVRSSIDNGSTWTDWRNRSFVYFSQLERWQNHSHDLTEHLEPEPTHLQVAFRVEDLAQIFAFVGDATPAPWFDNVSVKKFRVFGPGIRVVPHHLFQDTFPNSGAIDPGNPAALSCRLDMARDISTGSQLVPGDSVVVSVQPLHDTEVVGTTLEWILDVNPFFAGVRTMPPNTTVIPAGATNGWDQWRGSVAGVDAMTGGTWWFDLPDGPPNGNAPWQTADAAMFFPGDRLRYYFTAEDDEGRISTLPVDLSGFADGAGWDRQFLVRALPDMDGGGTHADLLYISAEGSGSHETLMLETLEGLLGPERGGTAIPGRFDIYSVKSGSSRVSNGIGSTFHHGASPDQLAGYTCVVYDSGRLFVGFPSDGSNSGSNDKSDDLGLLEAWHALPDDRNTVFLGDHVLGENGGSPFLLNHLGVEYVDGDVLDDLGTEDPEVTALPPFQMDFRLDGGCPEYRTFDAIRPATGVAGHGFEPGGHPVVPSVVYARAILGGTKTDITLPLTLGAVQSSGILTDEQVRMVVVADLLEALDHPVWQDPVPEARNPAIEMEGNRPNPFNPSTTVGFKVGRSAEYRATVYNARGERVTVLWNGLLDAGRHELTWSGRDDRGRSVASGLYFLELTGDGLRRTHKMALLK